MPHKDPSARRQYFLDWKAGIRRTSQDELGRRYIDTSMTSECIAQERKFRQFLRTREQQREDRRQAYADACKRLTREIERLKTMPFSWQREAK